MTERAFHEWQRRALINAIVCDASLPPLAVRAGVLLASRYLNDREGSAWPSQPCLKDDLDCDRSGLQRAIRRLDGRYFQIERPKRQGRGMALEYVPIWPERADGSPPLSDEKGRTYDHKKGGRETTKRADGSPPHKNKIDKIKEGGDFPSPEFEQFWASYSAVATTNSGSETKAREAWDSIIARGVSPVRLVHAALGYRKKVKADKSPPYAAAAWRFLAERRWAAFEMPWAEYRDGLKRDPDVWRPIWENQIGGPLPGEPGSVFPAELLGVADDCENGAGRMDENARWESLTEVYRRREDWEGAGPPPGAPGCRVPADIQRKYGFEPQAAAVKMAAI